MRASVGFVYDRLSYPGRRRERSSHLFHASSRIAVLGDTRSDCARVHVKPENVAEDRNAVRRFTVRTDEHRTHRCLTARRFGFQRGK